MGDARERIAEIIDMLCPHETEHDAVEPWMRVAASRILAALDTEAEPVAHADVDTIEGILPQHAPECTGHLDMVCDCTTFDEEVEALGRVVAALRGAVPPAWMVHWVDDGAEHYAYVIRRGETNWESRLHYAQTKELDGGARVVPLYTHPARVETIDE